MVLYKQLLGIILFFTGHAPSHSQQIPHYEIIFPDVVESGSSYKAQILTNYIINDLILFDEADQVIPFSLNMSPRQDQQFINVYELNLTAPIALKQDLRILITWDTGAKKIVQEFAYELQVTEKRTLDTQHPQAQIVTHIEMIEPVVQIYPNPSQGQFIYIERKSESVQPTILKIYDIFGQMVDEVQLNNKREVYRANRLQTGNYVFTFFSPTGVFSEKVKISRE